MRAHLGTALAALAFAVATRALAVAQPAPPPAPSATEVAAPEASPPPLGDHPRMPSQPHTSADMLFVTGVGPQPGATGDRALGDAASTRAGSPAAASPRQLEDGRQLYATHCASCHGADLQGVRPLSAPDSAYGTGGPALTRDGGSGVDFYLRTGRMPLAVTNLQAVHDLPHFDPAQIAAIDAYVDSRVTVVPIPVVRPDLSLLQHGRALFEDNCQSCHGAAAEGATAGYQWIALPLDQATPTQIGEAIRVGPGVMPRWNARQFSDDDISALATYIRYTIETPQDYGGSTLAYLGPVAEGLIGAILGVGSLFWVIYFTGTKADGMPLSGSRRRAEAEPDRT